MLRWAILGTGHISNTVAEAIKQSDNSQIHLVAGRDPVRVADFQNRFKLPASVVGYEAALDDPEIDVVYIGVPSHAHHEIAIMAAKKGKAILSEKPLTTTMDAANLLAKYVANSGVFFVEGLMYLAHPLCLRIQDILNEGKLGKVRAIHGFYSADIWRQANPKGKGTIYNLGCYPVSLTQFVMQTVFGESAFQDRISSAVGNVLENDGNVQDAAITVRFANGVLATLQCSNRYGMNHSFTIVGDKGVLKFKTNPWLPLAGVNVLEFHPNGAPGEVVLPEEIIVDAPFDAFHYQIKVVERCVLEGRTEAPRPSPRLSDSLEVMEFLTEWENLCRTQET